MHFTPPVLGSYCTRATRNQCIRIEDFDMQGRNRVQKVTRLSVKRSKRRSEKEACSVPKVDMIKACLRTSTHGWLLGSETHDWLLGWKLYINKRVDYNPTTMRPIKRL